MWILSLFTACMILVVSFVMQFMQTAISMKDLALSTDSKYIFACGSSLVKVWDRRMSGGPCQQLGITPLLGHVNSITSYVDNQVMCPN